ncbi:MAG: hypothetical protein ACYS8W_07130 [Planctomycetota bacterium]|jgi:hypothetical protein
MDMEKDLQETPDNAKTYCLYCYAPMHRKEDSCPVCHSRNLAADRKSFWTKEKNLVEVERILKMLIIFASIGIMVGIFVLPIGGGPGAGYLFALPVFFLVATWQTTSCLTRRVSTFRPSIYWSAFFLLVGIVFSLIIFINNDGLNNKIGLIYIAIIFPATLVLSYLCYKAGSKFVKWKNNRVEKMQQELLRTGLKPEPK